MNKILRYDNGLKVMVSSMPWTHSVSAGFWVGVGSAYENTTINGLSHFTEHMMFKGTDKLSPFDIANQFESYGANVNAFTSKECTCYYVKSIDEYSEKCFELLSEIMFKSTFPEVELNKERKVIVEEINMVEDSPEEICYDEIAYATYGNSGLGQTIIGTIDNVKRFNGDDIRSLVDKFYTADNIVVSLAGNITESQADEWIRKYVLPVINNKKAQKSKYVNEFFNRNYKERIKTFEQSNIAFSFPSITYGSEKATINAALITIMGGGMSSRLFQSLREQQGLAYSVYASPSVYAHNGTLAIYLNISDYNTQKAVSAVKEEIDKILDKGITQEELERTKVQLKSSLVFSSESVHSIMNVMGKNALLLGEVYDIDKKIQEINALTKDSVDGFAREIFDFAKVNVAYVGKKVDVDILDILK